MTSEKDCSFSEKELIGLDFFNLKLNKIYHPDPFYKFEDLKFECYFNETLTVIVLKPEIPLTLDSKLNLTNLYINPKTFNFILYVANLNGFDISYDPFKDVKVNETSDIHGELVIQWSNFNFFNQNKLLNEYDCGSNSSFIFQNILSSYIFTILKIKESVKFPKEICPLVFNNSNINTIYIENIEKTFVRTNLFILKNVSSNSFTELNKPFYKPLIKTLEAAMYNVDLNERFLNVFFFKNIVTFHLSGFINGVEDGLFKSFQNLKSIVIKTNNIRYFLHQNYKFIDDLNLFVKVNLNNHTEFNFFKNLSLGLNLGHEFYYLPTIIYDFPDQDICIFKNFPHNRLVYPILTMAYEKTEPCSCTTIWIIQFMHLYETYTETTICGKPRENFFFNILYCCLNSTIDDLVKTCNFTERFSLCNLTSVKFPNNEFENFGFNIYILLSISNVVYFFISIIVKPVTAFITIFLNILVILVINLKHKILAFKERMYKFLQIQSFFIIIHCILILFKLMNQCVSYGSVFCSSVYTQRVVQNFFINNEYVTYSIKTCSNISFIAMSFSRYSMITKINSNEKSDNAFKRFLKKNLFKTYLIVVIISSFLLNLNKLFEYQVNDVDFNYYESPIEIFYYCGIMLICNTIKIFFYINLIFNNCLCLLSNVCIDVALYVRIKNNEKKSTFLKAKIYVLAAYTNPNSNPNPTVNIKNKPVKIKNAKVKKNRNLTILIILNGLIFVILKLPEVLFYFFYMNSKIKENYCMEAINCAKYFDMIDFFSVLEYFFQFFIIKKFNKTFKAGIDLFLKKFKS